MKRTCLAVGLLAALGGLLGAAPTPEGAGPVAPPGKEARPVRVLLWAGAASREYQMLKALLLREAQDKRVDLTVCLQPAPGKAEPKRAVAADGPSARSLTRFPDELGARPPADRLAGAFDLASYEVVVAFDPDWSRLSEASAGKLRQWVLTNGGGLVLVAGAINTPQLAGTDGKLKAVRETLPVDLADGKDEKRDTTRPWALTFPKGKGRPAFLRLDDKDKGPLAGWGLFFRAGKAAPAKAGEGPELGFYSCHPVKSVRPGAVVLATFGDPKARSATGEERPYLAARRVGAGRVVYLGSGEIWRLAAYSAAYYERFWTGLLADSAGRR